jgi:tRNA-Thr(GGU) m(6)t(6)A37 methyltransferase TsaA
VTAFEVRLIGRVRSALTSRADAPRQGDEGAPDAALQLEPEFLPGLIGLAVGDEVLVLTWLHEADRTALSVHPRGDEARPAQGVFTTRSPDRPNPIGVHRVRVLALDGARVQVSGMEAIDGTPVLDLKPVLVDVAER